MSAFDLREDGCENPFMQGYWEHLQRLVNSGRPFVAVTLVDVVASAPANVGAKMLVTEQGLFWGTVGGGKIEAKAIAEAKGMLSQNAFACNQDSKHEQDAAFDNVSHLQRPAKHGGGGGGSGHSKFIEWNLQRDVGMTCGGVARLFFEAYNVQTWPIWVFGAGHCAQALVRLLLTLSCQVTVVDPREEWIARLPREEDSGGKLRIIHAAKPMREHVKEIPAHAFVLMMTMGHASDEPILIEILKTRPELPYVGVMGSEAKAAILRRGVLAAGVPEEALARYCCPIGLPIGTNDPAEIAVSVAGQLLERRDAGPGVSAKSEVAVMENRVDADAAVT